MASRGSARGSTASLGRALVVEDDVLVAMDMAAALTDGGAEKVAICASISAALQEMERTPPDLLVLDVHLADRDDGWSLAELAMQLSPVPPLIVFSTATPDSIPAETAALGHVLAKPFPPDALIRLVREHRAPTGLLARFRSHHR